MFLRMWAYMAYFVVNIEDFNLKEEKLIFKM